jgi:hypothetical protein
MKRSNGQSMPKARKTDLVTREIPGELLVYDLKRHKAFCLNETAATVWNYCNGKRTVAQLAERLDQKFSSPVDERIVLLALDQLERSHLLQAPGRPTRLTPLTRRALIRGGIITAIALPLVTAINSPVAAQAGSTITAAVCGTRHPNDPGGCGNNPCVGGGTCQSPNPGNNPCQCV